MHVRRAGIHSAKDALNQLKSFRFSPDWRRLAFYLGVPTMLALYGAINNLHAMQTEGFWMTLQFYVAHAYVPWWMTCLSTRLIFIALAHWQPPTPLVWSLGA